MPDRCEHIRDQIETLQLHVQSLQEQLATAAGIQKEMLVFLIKRELAEIAEKEIELQACVDVETPPLNDPRVFGFEITQGLPEYELVAGKGTLARVFVGVRQPVVLPVAAKDFASIKSALPEGFHFDVPPYRSSRLDFASLHISGPGSLGFEVPGTMSGLFTNFSKSLSEEDNVNFYIAGDLLAQVGSYHFQARFYRDGALVGTNNLGTFRFNDTGDVRMLITVDTFPMPADAWPTVLRALEFLHRNMPARAGIGPMDGDLSAGLRYYIDPVPFDPDWPDWGPVAQRFAEFNQNQAASGKPDRADKVMTVRTQQEGEPRRGGTARLGADISGVVLNLYPPGDNYFASIVSQEIGHNFNLGHAQDRLIPAVSAFDLLNRKSLSEARNIMSNPVGTNEFCLFSPEDWSTIRQGLLQLNSTGPA